MPLNSYAKILLKYRVKKMRKIIIVKEPRYCSFKETFPHGT